MFTSWDWTRNLLVTLQHNFVIFQSSLFQQKFFGIFSIESIALYNVFWSSFWNSLKNFPVKIDYIFNVNISIDQLITFRLSFLVYFYGQNFENVCRSSFWNSPNNFPVEIDLSILKFIHDKCALILVLLAIF